MYALFLMWFVAPDVEQLGSPYFEKREAASRRLKGWGFLAWGELARATRSEDPEVVERAWRLLTPLRRVQAELYAAWVILHPERVKPWEFASNDTLRLRVWKQAIAAGVSEEKAKPLHPDNDPIVWWWFGTPVWEASYAALCELKDLLPPDWLGN